MRPSNEAAQRAIDRFAKAGYGTLLLCIAKTHLSLYTTRS
jgi:formyltetrahydrofolate synthetase